MAEFGKRTLEEITSDVWADWGRPKDQDTIRRRWKQKTTDDEIITAEIRQRWWLQQRLAEVGGENGV